MAAPSFLNPIPTNAIIGDVNQIHALLNVLARVDPSLGSDYPEKSIRIKEVPADTARRRAEIKRARENGETPKPVFAIEIFRDGAWVSMGNFAGSASDLDGYKPSVNATPGTIPVYNANGELVGNITGNAATADKLKQPVKIDIGGIASATAQDFDGSTGITIPINSINLNNEADTAVQGVLTPEHGGTGRTDGAVSNVVMNSPQGEVSASEYGMLGPMKRVSKAETDADSLTVQGNYYIVGDTAGWAANHWPDSVGNNCRLSVYYMNQIIIQEYVSKVGGAWKRYSDNGGASFSGWQPLLETSGGHTQVFVSKSGNDANTGLDSGYPVQTMARAFEVADALATKANSNVNFYIGAGDWGELYVCRPYYVAFWPYDGGIPTEYSAELPRFSHLQFQKTIGLVHGIVARLAAENSCVYCPDSWMRLLGVIAINDSFLSVANSANVEFEGTDEWQTIQVSSLALVYANAIKIKLVANTSNKNGFIYVGLGGTLVLGSEFTVDLNGFSQNGRKAYIEAGGDLIDYRNVRDDYSINKLPGTGFYISNGGCINGMAWGQVLKSGDWMSGMLGIRRGWPHLDLRNTGIDEGTLPSANQYLGYQVTDKDGDYLGQLFHNVRPDGTIRAEMNVRHWTTASSKAQFALGVEVPVSGSNAVGVAPTPPSNDNTGHIATTAWVRTFHNANSSSGSVSNGTLTNCTLNNCQLSTHPAGTGNVNSYGIPDMYWVLQMFGSNWYGMLPTMTTRIDFSWSVWNNAPTNGWWHCSFPGVASQYWKMREQSWNGGTQIDMSYANTAFILPSRKGGGFYGYSQGIASSSRIGFMWATDPGILGRSAAIEMEAEESGGQTIYVVNKDGVAEAAGDLPSLVWLLEMPIPQYDDIAPDYEAVNVWRENAIKEAKENYEKAVADAKKDYGVLLDNRVKDIRAVYEPQIAAYKTRRAKGVEEDKPSPEMLMTNETSFEEGRLDAELGELLVRLEDDCKKRLEEIDLEYDGKLVEAHAEYESQLKVIRGERYAIFQEAAKRADLVVSVADWAENYSDAHVDENGKVVLGPKREAMIEIFDRNAKSRLTEYDDAIIQLERQKRFGQLASAKGRAAGLVARYASRLADIEAQILTWDLYAATIAMMPEQEGYPWDGGGKNTPWPEKPAKVKV